MEFHDISGAVLIALPVMVSLLFINLGIGVITRTAPALNIFAVGFPAMIIAGIILFSVSMTSIGYRSTVALAEIVGNHKRGLWVSIMAENDTAEERTEEPTAKRLEKARSEGRVARSQELSVAAMLIGTAIFLYFMGGYFIKRIAELFASGFIFDRRIIFTEENSLGTFGSFAAESFIILIPIFILTFLIAAISCRSLGRVCFFNRSSCAQIE